MDRDQVIVVEAGRRRRPRAGSAREGWVGRQPARQHLEGDLALHAELVVAIHLCPCRPCPAGPRCDSRRLMRPLAMVSCRRSWIPGSGGCRSGSVDRPRRRVHPAGGPGVPKGASPDRGWCGRAARRRLDGDRRRHHRRGDLPEAGARGLGGQLIAARQRRSIAGGDTASNLARSSRSATMRPRVSGSSRSGFFCVMPAPAAAGSRRWSRRWRRLWLGAARHGLGSPVRCNGAGARAHGPRRPPPERVPGAAGLWRHPAARTNAHQGAEVAPPRGPAQAMDGAACQRAGRGLTAFGP